MDKLIAAIVIIVTSGSAHAGPRYDTSTSPTTKGVPTASATPSTPGATGFGALVNPKLGFTASMAAAADAMSANLGSPATQAALAKAGYHSR